MRNHSSVASSAASSAERIQSATFHPYRGMSFDQIAFDFLRDFEADGLTERKQTQRQRTQRRDEIAEAVFLLDSDREQRHYSNSSRRWRRDRTAVLIDTRGFWGRACVGGEFGARSRMYLLYRLDLAIVCLNHSRI